MGLPGVENDARPHGIILHPFLASQLPYSAKIKNIMSFGQNPSKIIFNLIKSYKSYPPWGGAMYCVGHRTGFLFIGLQALGSLGVPLKREYERS